VDTPGLKHVQKAIVCGGEAW